VDRSDKEKLKKIIKDRIDELILMLQPLDRVGDSDDEAAKLDRLISSDVDTTVHSLAARDLQVLRRNLQWLETEEGGYCEQCGCEIQRGRLVALPSTRLCITCASHRETPR